MSPHTTVEGLALVENLAITGTAAPVGQALVAAPLTLALLALSSAAAWLLSGWIAVRAGAPTASLGSAFGSASDLLHGAIVGPRRSALHASAGALRLITLVPLALLALAVLYLTGHSPTQGPREILIAGGIVVTVSATMLVLTVVRNEQKGAWLAARGPHLLGAMIAGELLIMATSLSMAWVLTRSHGFPMSALEVAAAFAVARVATAVRLPLGGLGVADAVLVVLLSSSGMPLTVALLITLVWRLGITGAQVSAWLVGRSAVERGQLELPGAPTGSALGDRAHRAAFRLLGTLPAPLARRARTLVFHAMFAFSDDPWRYDELPYEARKRQVLVQALPRSPGTVVEVGCADGHNLAALAHRSPDATLVGVDISAKAVATAAHRLRDLPTARTVQADARSAPAALRAAGIETVDVLVLAEVLYYLGTPGQIEAEVRGLAAVLRPGAQVVLLHQDGDADPLHAAVARALGLTRVRRTLVEDPERPYVVEVLEHAAAGSVGTRAG